MIKVIKNAVLEPPRKMYFKITCDKCGSEFIFDSDDSAELARKMYESGAKVLLLHDNRAITCPVCNHLESYFLYNNTKFLSNNKSLTEISEEEYNKLIGVKND